MDIVKSESNEGGNQEIFRDSISELNRIVKGSFLTTALQITILVAMLAAPFFIRDLASKHHFEIPFDVEAVLVLLLMLQTYDLARHSRTKSVRDRLATQLKVAMMQRIRAEKLYDLSILDPLTSLHNRRFGEQRLDEEVARSERNGDPLAVLVFDLDYFKEINDGFGHAAGDAALKEFSRRLKRAIRACDVPVRIGGDEFLVILPECPREKVDIVLERIGSPEIRFHRQVISIPYSVGRAHYQVCDTSQTMMQRADQVLYAAKAARPNTEASEKDSRSSANRELEYQGPPSFETGRTLLTRHRNSPE